MLSHLPLTTDLLCLAEAAVPYFPVPDGPLGTNVPRIGIQIIVSVWVFVLGACFGSFLNVVIYRLPAGMSLGHPKSRCPRCETPLAAKDNVPILGWLFLRGKCRYCSLPIAARYPFIETTCGIIFLSLLLFELVSGGGNLPNWQSDAPIRIRRGYFLFWFTQWDVLSVYLYHSCLLIVLLAIAMIGYDGHRPAGKLVIFGLITGLVCGVVWFQIRPVHFHPDNNYLRNTVVSLFGSDSDLLIPRLVVGTADGLCGVALGALIGALLSWQMAIATDDPHEGAETNPVIGALTTMFVVTGGFLGWQAVGMLAIWALPVLGLTKVLALTHSRRWYKFAPPILFILTWLFLLTWNLLDQSNWMIGINGWPLTTLNWVQDWCITFIVLCVFALIFRKLSVSRLATKPSDSHVEHDSPEL